MSTPEKTDNKKTEDSVLHLEGPVDAILRRYDHLAIWKDIGVAETRTEGFGDWTRGQAPEWLIALQFELEPRDEAKNMPELMLNVYRHLVIRFAEVPKPRLIVGLDRGVPVQDDIGGYKFEKAHITLVGGAKKKSIGKKKSSAKKKATRRKSK